MNVKRRTFVLPSVCFVITNQRLVRPPRLEELLELPRDDDELTRLDELLAGLLLRLDDELL